MKRGVTVSVPVGSPREGSYVVETGEGGEATLYRIRRGERVRERATIAYVTRLSGLVVLRDLARRLVELEAEGAKPDAIETARSGLGARYDEFVRAFGSVNDPQNLEALRDDPDRPLVLSLERPTDDGNWHRGPIFERRIVEARDIPDRVDSIERAVGASMLAFGTVDTQFVSRVLGMDREHAEAAIVDSRLALRDPDRGGSFVSSDVYLSGDVKSKLAAARTAAERDSAYTANVDALERVQPDPVAFEEIDVRLGAAWIPETDIESFVKELVSVSVKVTHIAERAEWKIEERNHGGWQVRASPNRQKWGTNRVPAVRLIEALANQQWPVVRTTNDSGKSVVDVAETEAARACALRVEAAFADWVGRDPVRRRRLERAYNDRYVRFRDRDFSAAEFEFVPTGMDPDWAARLRPEQRSATRRIASGLNTLLAHATGAGKTASLIAGGMELKQHGRCHRPAYVVQNNSFTQFVRSFAEIYPGVRLLTVPPGSLANGGLAELFERAAAGNFDAVVIAHSTFGRIHLSASKRRALLRAERDRLRASKSGELTSANPNEHRLEVLARRLAAVDDRIAKLRSKRDSPYAFERLGIDALLVDEAHHFKSIAPEETKLHGVLGIPMTQAARAADLLEKVRHIERVREGEGAIVFATATPLTNSVAEIHGLMRFLERDRLASLGLEHFDAWASVFARTRTEIEVGADSGRVTQTRFSEFVNVAELRSILAEVADVRTARDLGLPTPRLATGKAIPVECPMSPEQVAYLKVLEKRVGSIRGGKSSRNKDNMLVVTTDARKVAIDMRLVDPSLPEAPDGKVARIAANAAGIWKETAPDRSTQIIFCDLGVPGSATGFSVYDAIRDRLVACGVASDDIAFAQEAKSPEQKAELYGKVDRGDVRILIGSSGVLGEAVNVQSRCIAAHHCDVPFAPYRLDQRDGRIERQGNRNPEIRIFHYIATSTDGRPSLDAYMWSLCARKARSIERLLAGRVSRRMEDVGRRSMACAEFLAFSLDNPAGREHMTVDAKHADVAADYGAYLADREKTHRSLAREIPSLLASCSIDIARAESDWAAWEATPPAPPIQIGRRRFADRDRAGAALLDAIRCSAPRPGGEPVIVGRIGPFAIATVSTRQGPAARLLGVETPVGRSSTDLGVRRSPRRLIEALLEAYESLPGASARHREQRDRINARAVALESDLAAPYGRAAELRALETRKRELEEQLGLGITSAKTTSPDAGPREPDHIGEPVRHNRKGRAVWTVGTEVGWMHPAYAKLGRAAHVLGGELEGSEPKGVSSYRFTSAESARIFGSIVDLRSGAFKPYDVEADTDIARRIGAGTLSVGEFRLQFDRMVETMDAYRASVHVYLVNRGTPAETIADAVDSRVRSSVQRFALGRPLPPSTAGLVERVRDLVARHTKADLDRMRAAKNDAIDTAPGTGSPSPTAGHVDGVRLVKKPTQQIR